MRYREIINELFIQPAEWLQVRNGPHMKSYEFTIQNIKYEADIIYLVKSNSWGVAFDVDSNDDNDYKLTGTGNATLVLATVLDIIKSFVAEHKPQSITFTAAIDEPSRVSLYRRMAGKLAPNEYTVTETNEVDQIRFKLTRNDNIQEDTLNELVGVKRFKNMTATEIRDWIDENMGSGEVRVLGKGAHATAIMMGQNVYKLWMVDSAYTAFVNYALQHTGNPFLPQFYSGIKKMPAFFLKDGRAPNYVNYIRMEKLTMAFRDQYKFTLGNGEQINWHQALQVFHDLIAYNNAKDIPSNLNYILTLIEEEGTLPVTQDDLPLELMTFLHTLMDVRNLDYSLDIHHGNFMMRDNQLVILDPIKNEYDVHLNDSFALYDRDLRLRASFYNQLNKKKADSKKD